MKYLFCFLPFVTLTQANIINLDELVSSYYNDFCAKLSLEQVCYSSIDIHGEIKTDRGITFDYMPIFIYTYNTHKIKTVSGNED